MPNRTLMNLKILLPFCVFANETSVTRIVADTNSGSMGILPHRMDCVAALTPGILVYEIGDEGEVYLAVDNGILIKTGFDVLLSVRNAIRGSDLKELVELVEQKFLNLNERERNVRSVMAKMESDFISRIATYTNG